MDSSEGKTYERFIDYIKRSVYDKELQLGDRLPTERKLSTKLNMGRNSIREALRTLEILGFVESRQGSGNYLACNIADTVFASISFAIVMGVFSFPEVVRLRHVLELDAFARAFSSFDDESTNNLRVALEELESCENDAKYIHDAKFHNALFLAGQNELFRVLSDGINSVYVSIASAKPPKFTPDDRQRLRDSHRNVYTALSEGDYSRGVNAINTHYDIINSYLPELPTEYLLNN